MAHNIYLIDYKESVPKKRIQRECDEYVAREDWMEGATGLSTPIRFLSRVCDDREQAEEYIESQDNGWYDSLAVRYLRYGAHKVTKREVELRESLADYEKRLKAYREAHEVRKQKAEFVTCKCCGSKLKRELMKRNTCPLCGKEMRSATAMEQIRRYEQRVADIKVQLKELESKARDPKKAKVMWLVKIEYHT